MGGPRHRPPLPLPPPRGAIVVDGANVIASSKAQPLQRLDLVTAWAAVWRPDLPVMVFIDHNTARRCRPEVQDVLRARCADVTPGRPRYAVVPRDQFADEHVLRFAAAHRGLVVSNDRYMDGEDLRADAVLVQFQLADGVLRVADEAVWFKPSGGAQWVATADLRQQLPDG
ncbi:MAG: hypothetical protein ACK6D1_18695 [Planctomycetota bacterium]